ncbi:MAG: hypothetical protein M3063_13035 [Actinomycetota bacterium]|nr:hypothetical protein [Actinomycetota bacterium]
MSQQACGPSIMAFAGLGLLNAICLLAGMGLGWLADTEVGTLPLFLFIGLVTGIVVGILATRAELRRL